MNQLFLKHVLPSLALGLLFCQFALANPQNTPSQQTTSPQIPEDIFNLTVAPFLTNSKHKRVPFTRSGIHTILTQERQESEDKLKVSRIALREALNLVAAHPELLDESEHLYGIWQFDIRDIIRFEDQKHIFQVFHPRSSEENSEHQHVLESIFTIFEQSFERLLNNGLHNYKNKLKEKSTISQVSSKLLSFLSGRARKDSLAFENLKYNQDNWASFPLLSHHHIQRLLASAHHSYNIAAELSSLNPLVFLKSSASISESNRLMSDFFEELYQISKNYADNTNSSMYRYTVQHLAKNSFVSSSLLRKIATDTFEARKRLEFEARKRVKKVGVYHVGGYHYHLSQIHILNALAKNPSTPQDVLDQLAAFITAPELDISFMAARYDRDHPSFFPLLESICANPKLSQDQLVRLFKKTRRNPDREIQTRPYLALLSNPKVPKTLARQVLKKLKAIQAGARANRFDYYGDSDDDVDAYVDPDSSSSENGNRIILSAMATDDQSTTDDQTNNTPHGTEREEHKDLIINLNPLVYSDRDSERFQERESKVLHAEITSTMLRSHPVSAANFEHYILAYRNHPRLGGQEMLSEPDVDLAKNTVSRFGDVEFSKILELPRADFKRYLALIQNPSTSAQIRQQVLNKVESLQSPSRQLSLLLALAFSR